MHKRRRRLIKRRGLISMDYIMAMAVAVVITFGFYELLLKGLSALFRYTSDALGWLPF